MEDENPEVPAQETPPAPETPTDDLRAAVASLTAELDAERTGHQATRDQLAAAGQQLEQAQAALSGAAGRYRDALLGSNPGVPPELLTGDSIETLDASLEAAKGIVQSVIERAAQPAPPGPPVPAGAPVRGAPDVSAMSPAEKIKYALGQR